MIRRICRLLCISFALLLASPALAGDGNRLTYLDKFCDPYYVGRTFPKLTTPQWVGEEGVEAVVVLAIDDMRGHAKWEAYLRPILERLKKIDGRAPVSIMTCRIDPAEPHLQTWLGEGLSLEVHTYDHPCPLLQGGDFARAKETYEKCVDMMAAIPQSRPVAFRMPCCDSRNTPSPRFFTEIFNSATAKGNFLAIDSSVFNVTTPADAQLPRELVLENGKPRFRKYLPFPSFVNTIDDYPYPYVISRLGWQFPCMVPSDWEAQHVQKPNNPITVRDLKLALDAAVIKRGTLNFVFHPYNWIRAQQVVELIDHAASKHGRKVKFLTFREALERINRNLLAGQSLRAKDGTDAGVRLLDLNNDGYLDVVIGNPALRQTRIWSPKTQSWTSGELPIELVKSSAAGNRETGVRFGIVGDAGMPVVLVRNDEVSAAFRFDGNEWKADDSLLAGLEIDGTPVLFSQSGIDQGVRLRDLDGDGVCELIAGGTDQRAVFTWQADEHRWRRLPWALPGESNIVDAQGRDAGLRFVDLDQDGHDDVLFSNENQYGVYLFTSLAKGWQAAQLVGRRGDANAIPMITRAGTNNGAWFARRHLWVQNEDTNRLPDGVDRRSFDSLMANAGKPPNKDGETPNPDTSRTGGIPPRGPQESLAMIETSAAMHVELVAAEPLVADPVAIDWGPDGRLWVVEMHDYPNGLDGQGKPGGRVKFLEDTDGDGRYDRATTFLDGVPFPTGVKVWRKGIIVSAAPTIFYAEDRDGDGRADERKTLYEGFGEGNQQHRVNGLRWGLDNWLYVGNGDSGGTIRSAMTGKQVNVSKRDLRIRPDDGSLDAQSGNTQYGINRDDWGNWFGGNNSTPLWHYVLRDEYLRRNAHVAPPDVRNRLFNPPSAAPIFPVSRTLPRFNNPNSTNRFTSACSPIIYRDRLLGDAYTGNVFVCEPVHNLVHREIITPSGVTFECRRAESEREAEFLASRDNWFRPAMVRTGPDGALWVVDMYRFVIEHPKWIPPDMQRELDLRAGDQMGRIYRVYPTGTKPRTLPRLDQMDPAELAAVLESPNGPLRDLAQQMLLWRADRKVAPELERLTRESKSPTARLHALCTLDGLAALDDAVVQHALADEHPGVRRHAVRLAEPRLKSSAAVAKRVLSLAEDSDPQVQLQLAYTLGAWDDPLAAATLAKLGIAHQSDPYRLAAVLSSVNANNVAAVLAEVLKTKNTRPPERLVSPLLEMAAAMGADEAIAQAIVHVVQPREDKYSAWQFAALAGLADAAARRKRPLESILGSNRGKTLPELLTAARKLAGDERADEPLRLAAIKLLGSSAARRPEDFDTLGKLLVPQNTPAVQSAAVAALSRRADAKVPARLLAGWRSHSPALRAQILDIHLSRNDWLAALITSIEQGTLPAGEIDARRRQQLLTHKDAGVRDRAKKLFAAATSTSRREVLAAHQPVLAMRGDVARGRAVFKQRCSTCHRLENVGHSLGADLASLTNRTAGALLVAILDPNRAVEDKFFDYAVITDDGRTLTGILAAETGNSITLVGPEGKKYVVLRREIDELRTSGKSLMPEGMEKDLKHQDLADVIAYVANFRPPRKQFAGNEPQTVRPRSDGSLALRAADCSIYGEGLRFESKYQNLGYWNGDDDHAVWTVELKTAGKYRVSLDYACQDDHAGNRFVLEAAGQKLAAVVEGTGSWDRYRKQTLGEIDLPAGTTELVARSDAPIRRALMDLRKIVLVPVK